MAARSKRLCLCPRKRVHIDRVLSNPAGLFPVDRMDAIPGTPLLDRLSLSLLPSLSEGSSTGRQFLLGN